MYQTSENSRSNWNLEVLVFEERGKTEDPEQSGLKVISNTH